MRKIRHEEGKVTYIVYCPWRDKSSGGQVALHSLTKNLADAGEIVYILSKPLFSCNAKTLKSSYDNGRVDVSPIEFDPNRTVVIYPEIIEGNPLGAKHVVRWILYNTQPRIEESWDPCDEYWYYLPMFGTVRERKKKFLSAFNFRLELFGKKREPTRDKILLLRKNTPKDFSGMDSFEATGMEKFIEKVSDYKYFFTYDDATYYSIAASLVGCVSVVLNPVMPPDEYRRRNPLFEYGVAYGDDEDEIRRAQKTQNLLKLHLTEMEKKSIEQTEEFRAYWKKRIYDL